VRSSEACSLGAEGRPWCIREASSCGNGAAWLRRSHDTLIGRLMLSRDLRQQGLAGRLECVICEQGIVGRR
jgi:hypothetical protein